MRDLARPGDRRHRLRRPARRQPRRVLGRRRCDPRRLDARHAARRHSRYVWRVKHNVAHHTYTNVAGDDDDIDLEPFLRLLPEQPLAVVPPAAHLHLGAVRPVRAANAVHGRLPRAHQRPRRPEQRAGRAAGVFGYVAGKVIFLGWVVAIPLLVSSVVGRAGRLRRLVSFTRRRRSPSRSSSRTAWRRRLPVARGAADATPHGWAAHQIETTVDFAPATAS